MSHFASIGGAVSLFDKQSCVHVELVLVDPKRKQHFHDIGPDECICSSLCFYVCVCHGVFCVCLLCLSTVTLFIMVIYFLFWMKYAFPEHYGVLSPAKSNGGSITITLSRCVNQAILRPISCWLSSSPNLSSCMKKYWLRRVLCVFLCSEGFLGSMVKWCWALRLDCQNDSLHEQLCWSSLFKL